MQVVCSGFEPKASYERRKQFHGPLKIINKIIIISTEESLLLVGRCVVEIF